MRGRGRLCLTLAALSALAALDTPAQRPAGRPRGVLLSLDGAGGPLLDDAVARGVMPNLARLRAAGAVARGSAGPLPLKTAPSHAVLFTGAWADRNGIRGNRMLLAGANPLESVDGYSAEYLRAEPIWMAAVRQGRRASVAAAPFAGPFEPYEDERRFGATSGLTLLDGYRGERDGPRVLGLADLQRHGDPRAFEFAYAGSVLGGLLFDDPDDPVKGFDSLRLTLAGAAAPGVVLKPHPARGLDPSAFGALQLRHGGGDAMLFARLFELAPDGSRLALLVMPPHRLRSNRTALEHVAFEATGGFLGNGASWAYSDGLYGATLDRGGDGTAERRYLESVALVIRQFSRLLAFAADRTEWDLLVGYLPYPDEALHTWLGFLDPALPSHDRALAARLRPHLDEVLKGVDGYVGLAAEKAGANAVVAVAADHGLIGADRAVRPNVLLREAGLVELLPDGRLDLPRSRVVYPPANQAFLVLNTATRGGPVRPGEADVLLRTASRALAAARDPASGARLFTGVVDPRAPGVVPGLGGDGGGDLYLVLAPGYALSADTAPPAVAPRRPGGDHWTAAAGEAVLAGFTVAGPGVARGASLGTIEQVDVAPTLCALLGLDPPAHAVGKLLRATLPAAR